MKFFESYTPIIALAAGCAGLGCSAKVVDLGNNPAGQSSGPVYSSGIPTAADSGATVGAMPFRIVDKEGTWCASSGSVNADAMSVASGRLYWFSQSNIDYAYSLKSCAVDDCASSLVTSESYATQSFFCAEPPSSVILQTDQDMVYWLFELFRYGIFKVSREPNANIISVTSPASPTSFVVDNGTLFASTSDNTVLQCDASDCVNTAARFAMTPPAGAATYNSGVIFGQDSGYLYLAQGTIFLRVPKDTTASFEVLGELPPTNLGAITVYGDNIYWVENIALGQLMSCPKSGCVGSPTILMTGLNRPTAIAFDESSLYVLEPPVSVQGGQVAPSVVAITVTQTGRILKCPLTGCDKAQVIYTSTTEAKMENLIVDDRFVYFRGNDCTEANLTSSDPGWSVGCSFIAAIPK